MAISRKQFAREQNNLLLIGNSKKQVKNYSLVINFGKYKGMKLSEIKIINPSYVKFLASDVFHAKSNHFKEIQKEAILLTI